MARREASIQCRLRNFPARREPLVDGPRRHCVQRAAGRSRHGAEPRSGADGLQKLGILWICRLYARLGAYYNQEEHII